VRPEICEAPVEAEEEDETRWRPAE
jgi:hypothetical protein